MSFSEQDRGCMNISTQRHLRTNSLIVLHWCKRCKNIEIRGGESPQPFVLWVDKQLLHSVGLTGLVRGFIIAHRFKIKLF